MNRTNKQQKGKAAEETASHFLQMKGLKLIMQNYTCHFGEIDIIMRDKDDIVFVEVRSRSRKEYGLACETINKNKQKKLIKSALYFLQGKKWLDKVNGRFDIVAIQFVSDKPELEWIKNAFGP
jgi:putative endonuclease